jgi:pilus assembly protein Flp/PilA
MQVRRLPETIHRFAHNEHGATAIEYALIAAGIAVAVASAVMSLGDSVKAMYDRIYNALLNQ